MLDPSEYGRGGSGTSDLTCFCGYGPILDLCPVRDLHLGRALGVSCSLCLEATPPGATAMFIHIGAAGQQGV